MTEFAGSTPVGGIAVEVRLDERPYLRALGNLRARIAKNEGMGRLAMAPTAQQAFGAQWGMGGPGWTGGGAGAGGGGAVPGWAGGGAGAAPGPGGGTAPAGGAGARPAPGGGSIWTRPASITTGGHGSILSIYGIARATEAIMELGTAAIKAGRDYKVATNDTGRIAAMVEGRKGYESALSNIPIFGPLFGKARNLIDTARGVSPEDIQREVEEGERNRAFSQETSDRASSRRVRRAQNTADADKLFLGPGGSMASNLALIEEQRKDAQKKISDEASERQKQLQTTEAPPIWDKGTAFYKEWEAKNAEIKGKKGIIESDRVKDIAENNRKYGLQKWEQLIGGRSEAQQVNPFDVALGKGAVRTDSLAGQDPDVLEALRRIADNTGGEPEAPRTGRN